MKTQTGRQKLASSLMLVLSFFLMIAPRAEAAQYVYDEGNRLRWIEYGNGKVVEHVYDGEGNRVNTLISGTLPADVSVSSTRLDYGTKAVGSTTTKVLTIYNNGSSVLDLGNLSLTDTTNYQIGNNNCSGQIAASGSCTVEITFHPTVSSPGGIYLNASNKPTFSVLLGGEAVTTLPAKAIVIANDAEYTNSTGVSLTISAPYPPNVSQMCLSNTASCSNWVTYATTASWTLLSGNGNKYVYAQFRVQLQDNSWLVSNTYSDSIVMETGLPTGSILIDGGAAYTTSAQVNLTMTGSDSGSGVEQMRFSSDGTNWSAWEPFATSKTRTLTSGNGTKTEYVQYLDNAGNTSTVYSDTILLTYKQILDYEGDNKSDLSFWRESSGDGYWYIKRSSDGSESTTQWGSGSLNDIPVPGDYDGDGKTDIAVWRPENGVWFIKRSSDQGVTLQTWGLGSLNDIPVPGDYDGDGKTDFAVWRPGDGVWYILRSSDQEATTQAWGSGSLNDIPVPGDYDGDGKTDLAVLRQIGGYGYWYIKRSSDEDYMAIQWGAGFLNDIPVPADYDGDGKTDIAVWRPGDGIWYIRRSSDEGETDIAWGSSLYNHVPVPGDYDGDGKTDAAVWEPGSGGWYIKRSSDGGSSITVWGTNGDEPLYY